MLTFMGCLSVGMLACALLVSLTVIVIYCLQTAWKTIYPLTKVEKVFAVLVGLMAALSLDGIILVMVTSVLAAILV